MSQEIFPKLNHKNINRLIERLKALPAGTFKMSTYGSHIDVDKACKAGRSTGAGAFGLGLYHECNTACCLAGWANLINLSEDLGQKPAEINLDSLADSCRAAEWLGISEPQARELFSGHWSANVSQAIRCLEILRDQGSVQWDIAIHGQVAMYEAGASAVEPTND